MESLTEARDGIRSVHTVPLTHISPNASPFLLMNHSSKKSTVGEYAIVPPTAYMIHWVRINCVFEVTKDPSASDTLVMNSPTRVEGGRVCGQRCKIKKMTGKLRYMIPCGCVRNFSGQGLLGHAMTEESFIFLSLHVHMGGSGIAWASPHLATGGRRPAE